MPELPEVQTVINSLQPTLPGKIIQSVQCPNGHKGVFENGSLIDYKKFLIGKTLVSKMHSLTVSVFWENMGDCRLNYKESLYILVM